MPLAARAAEGVPGPGVIDSAGQGQMTNEVEVLAPEQALDGLPGQGCLVLETLAVAVERAVGQEKPEVEHGKRGVAAGAGPAVCVVAAVGLRLERRGEA